LLRTYTIYSSTPSTFDSFDNETCVQSNEWIYIKRHKRLDFVTLCRSYFAYPLRDCSKWPLCNLESELRGTFPNNICHTFKHISSFYPSAISKELIYF